MRVLESATLDLRSLTDEERYWSYNGLDCCITYEVWEALREAKGGFAYDMSRTMQAPAWSLMNRGIKVNFQERDTVAAALRIRRARAVYIFYRLIQEAFDFPATDKTLTSPQQLKNLFYETLALPVQRKFNKDTREYAPSVDRASLEKLQLYDKAKHLVDLILFVRDCDKKIQVLEAGITNGRMHFGYHVAGTMTGRWSSSENVFGDGTNGQNLTDEMRRVFVADKGLKLCQLDLAQAESKLVAYLTLPFGRQYLEACNSGDLHTSVSKLVWPELFAGTNETDKDVAKRPFYRHFTYRDMSKRGGHACLTPDHEVLTAAGWVPITEKPSQIMAFNPQTGSAFEQVEHWIDEQQTSKFVEVDEQALSFKVTANHRILGTTGTTLGVYAAGALPKSLRVVKGWGYNNTWAYSTIKKKTITEETARVLCPTVQSSFFYIRRNGKISVTGNSNYVGTPPIISMHLKIPLSNAKDFQGRYFTAFPGILKWHNKIRMDLANGKPITTPLGRRCHFPGRAWDNDTIKSAVAYVPQSSIGDILNLGFYKIWLKYDKCNVGSHFIHEGRFVPAIELLTQVHDSVLFQYDPAYEHIIIPLLQRELQIPITINDEECLIGVDAQIGWNWGKVIVTTDSNGAKVVENEFGLRDYTGADDRRYQEPSFLDRRFSPAH